MFDIGFSEILIIALIGLIFIGPERLPETVRTISLYIGRFKRSLRDTRREIEQQLGADDIRRELHNEEVMKSLEKLRNDVQKDVKDTLDFEDDLYPPGHHDHDPNNDLDEETPAPWRPDSTNDDGEPENTIHNPSSNESATEKPSVNKSQ